MKKIDISVCVTTYKRPQKLKLTLASFFAQTYKNAEIVIVNDAPDDIETDKVIKQYSKKHKNIRYIKNVKNLGYCKNFLKSLTSAQGKYIVTLGDDDILLNKNALQKYVDVFEKYKDVAFIYSNIIQFNDKLSPSYRYKYFNNNRMFKAGVDALSSVWLNSMFIAGIGLRNSADLKKFYPGDTVLFPQLEMVGKILLDHGAYGFSDYLIGACAHSDQLGFHMMKNKRTVGKEKHGYLELYEIYDRIAHYSKKMKKNINMDVIRGVVDALVKSADATSVVVEATYLDKKTLMRSISAIVREEKRIKHSMFFWMQVAAVLLLPNRVIMGMKETLRNLLLTFLWREEVVYFNNKIKIIKKFL